MDRVVVIIDWHALVAASLLVGLAMLALWLAIDRYNAAVHVYEAMSSFTCGMCPRPAGCY